MSVFRQCVTSTAQQENGGQQAGGGGFKFPFGFGSNFAGDARVSLRFAQLCLNMMVQSASPLILEC
jgi:hypothetical protein